MLPRRAAVVQKNHKPSSTALTALFNSNSSLQHLVTQTVRIGAHCAALSAARALCAGGRNVVSVTHSVMSWYFFWVELVDWFAFTIYNDLHWNNITKNDKK